MKTKREREYWENIILAVYLTLLALLAGTIVALVVKFICLL